MHKELVNCLVNLALESLVRRNERPDMTIAVDWDVKHKTKPKNAVILTFAQYINMYNVRFHILYISC